MIPDFEYLIVRFHHRPSPSATLPGPKKGGLKIQALGSLARRSEHQDTHGRPRVWDGPVRFTLTGRPERRCTASPPALIEGLSAEVVMADTAYDADHLRQAIAAKGRTRRHFPTIRPRALKISASTSIFMLKRPSRRMLLLKAQAVSGPPSQHASKRPLGNYQAVVTLAAIILWMANKCPQDLEHLVRGPEFCRSGARQRPAECDRQHESDGGLSPSPAHRSRTANTAATARSGSAPGNMP